MSNDRLSEVLLTECESEFERIWAVISRTPYADIGDDEMDFIMIQLRYLHEKGRVTHKRFRPGYETWTQYSLYQIFWETDDNRQTEGVYMDEDTVRTQLGEITDKMSIWEQDVFVSQMHFLATLEQQDVASAHAFKTAYVDDNASSDDSSFFSDVLQGTPEFSVYSFIFQKYLLQSRSDRAHTESERLKIARDVIIKTHVLFGNCLECAPENKPCFVQFGLLDWLVDVWCERIYIDYTDNRIKSQNLTLGELIDAYDRLLAVKGAVYGTPFVNMRTAGPYDRVKTLTQALQDEIENFREFARKTFSIKVEHTEPQVFMTNILLLGALSNRQSGQQLRLYIDDDDNESLFEENDHLVKFIHTLDVYTKQKLGTNIRRMFGEVLERCHGELRIDDNQLSTYIKCLLHVLALKPPKTILDLKFWTQQRLMEFQRDRGNSGQSSDSDDPNESYDIALTIEAEHKRLVQMPQDFFDLMLQQNLQFVRHRQVGCDYVYRLIKPDFVVFHHRREDPPNFADQTALLHSYQLRYRISKLCSLHETLRKII